MIDLSLKLVDWYIFDYPPNLPIVREGDKVYWGNTTLLGVVQELPRIDLVASDAPREIREMEIQKAFWERRRNDPEFAKKFLRK